MNVREALNIQANNEKLRLSFPIGAQPATFDNSNATNDATGAQQTACNPSKMGLSPATDTATTQQLNGCAPTQLSGLKVALKKRVASTVAQQLRPAELAQQSCTWALRFADSTDKPTHIVSVPPVSREQVLKRFEGQGLLACAVDQGCASCGWRIGHAIHGSPVWCSNPRLQDQLQPVYSPNHPAREIPDDHGACCTEFTTSKPAGANHDA